MAQNRIREVLLEQGKSIQWISEKTGMSYFKTSIYVRNKQQAPIYELKEIAEALGVDYRELWDDSR